MKGKIYIISAPSGTGKSTLIRALLKIKNLCNAQLSISYTTRDIRSGEINGKHYHFISKIEFEYMINKNMFLEYAKVFDHYYGTERKITDQILSSGKDILLDIDWQGAQQIYYQFPEVCRIFILPPSKKELNYRLRKRGQDNEKVIFNRIKQTVNEISHLKDYDYLIINNNFNDALLELIIIIEAERLRISKQSIRYNILIKNLLKN